MHVTPQHSKNKVKQTNMFELGNLRLESQRYPVQSTFSKFLSRKDPESFTQVDSKTISKIKMLKDLLSC